MHRALDAEDSLVGGSGVLAGRARQGLLPVPTTGNTAPAHAYRRLVLRVAFAGPAFLATVTLRRLRGWSIPVFVLAGVLPGSRPGR